MEITDKINRNSDESRTNTVGHARRLLLIGAGSCVRACALGFILFFLYILLLSILPIPPVIGCLWLVRKNERIMKGSLINSGRWFLGDFTICVIYLSSFFLK